MLAITRFSIALLACLTLALLGGCAGAGGTGQGTSPTVFFVDASADAGLIDFLLNGTFHETGLDYLEASTDFGSIPFISDDSGGYDLVTRENSTGMDLDAENRVFSAGTHSIVVALGLKAFPVGEDLKRFRSVVIQVDRSAPNGNKARLYVVHAFVREADQATPRIKFQNAGDNPQFFTGGIDFGSATSLTVDSGTMDWWAKREDATGDVVYALATATLDPASVYLVLVSGIENDADIAKQPKLTFVKLTTV